MANKTDPPPVAAKAPAVLKRTRQPSQYPDHYNLKLRLGDRERFDDYAYRHRLKKGEAMSRLLDLAEAEEAQQTQKASTEPVGQTDGRPK